VVGIPTLTIVLALGALEPPPIQRPKSMQVPEPAPVEPSAVPVEPTPVEPTPVEPTLPIAPPPIEPPPIEPIEPPPVEPIAPPPTATAPIEPIAPLGGESAPVDDEVPAPAGPRPISPAFRRPGIWVGAGVGLFALSTVLHGVLPRVGDCSSCDPLAGAIGLSIGSFAIDAATMTIWGFAGRSYGLRRARSGEDLDTLATRRRIAIGSGAALVVAGAVVSIGVLASQVVNDKPDVFSWTYAGTRIGAVAIGSLGAALIGYGVALPKPRPFARTHLAPGLLRGGASIGLRGRF
jgi:hypothetical protein